MSSGPPPVERVELLGLAGGEWDAIVPALLAELGEPRYRSRQLREWVFRKTPADFAGMSDLPAALRLRLAEIAVLHPLRLLEERVSRDGTRKYLWERAGSGPIESVMIPEDFEEESPAESDDERGPDEEAGPDREAGAAPRSRVSRSPSGAKRSRTTYCLSTQAGCPVRCTFCATGYGGFEGQLSAAEIVDQVVLMRPLCGRAPTNLVFMGMGEPLLNFPATMGALEVLCDPEGIGMGARRITVSTVGVRERIAELGRRFPQVKLALSLHAARSEVRSEIIPLDRKFPLAEVVGEVREHARITGKMPTFEYVVLPGVNDARDDARAIVRLLEGLPSRVNLIEFNPFPGVDYQKPSVQRMEEFRRWIQADGFPGSVTIRRSRGEDIHGACGQLSLAAGNAATARSATPEA